MVRIEDVDRALADAITELDGLISLYAREEKGEVGKSAWEAYVKSEHAIALMRLALDIEEPGRRASSRPSTGDPSKVIVEAYDSLRESRDALKASGYQKALGAARRGRDLLRDLIIMSRGPQRKG